MYPDVVASTPSSLSKDGSMHQKQPPANVAIMLPGGLAGSGAIWASTVVAASVARTNTRFRNARRNADGRVVIELLVV
jgi:hypothetical protein